MTAATTPAPQANGTAAGQGLSTAVLLLMSVAAGLCAGSNYFNQPLLHSISVALNIAESTAAATVTLAQVSYALGVVLLVPLGDMLERRRLAVVLMLLAATGLFVSGFARGIGMLAVGTAMTGLFSVAAQTLVPMAATLSDPRRSGRAVGIVMSGLLVGILGARSVAGLLSGLGGWTTVYRAAGVAMVLVAFVLWRLLPASRNPVRTGYGEVMRSMALLARDQPRLRSRALMGGLSFGSVSVLFSTMALMLAGPVHRLGDAQIGLVGLAGVAGASMANVAGRLADRGLLQVTSGVSAALLALSWAALWQGGGSLAWFLAGMLLIDLALQGIHISNQNVIYKLAPQARSRVNAVYMTSYFIGAATGSALGSWAWQHGGWSAACGWGLALAVVAAGAWLHDIRLERLARRPPAATSAPRAG